jgi:hypothetical protein
MKQFPTFLTAGLNKARKRPLALLVCVALLVTAADLALMAVHRLSKTANRARLADAVRPFHFDAASASAADHTTPAGATGIRQTGGWGLFPLRWSSFTLPYGAEEGRVTDPRRYLPGR